MVLAKTGRLIIRILTINDANDYAAIVADPEVMKFIGSGKPQTPKEAGEYVEKCIENFNAYGWARFAVTSKESGELLGLCGYAIYNNELDFGWKYASRFWNKGYGFEAAKAVLDLGIRKYRFPRIVCISYPENKGSIRIIEKIGMVFERDIFLEGKLLKKYVKLNY
ncbi:MAG: GNAT family N-acetyltransferase [Bacteroidetes bacterium]|nr:GNAT family N-acetyltransferase [Bacteroidota bacterium]